MPTRQRDPDPDGSRGLSRDLDISRSRGLSRDLDLDPIPVLQQLIVIDSVNPDLVPGAAGERRGR